MKTPLHHPRPVEFFRNERNLILEVGLVTVAKLDRLAGSAAHIDAAVGLLASLRARGRLGSPWLRTSNGSTFVALSQLPAARCTVESSMNRRLPTVSASLVPERSRGSELRQAPADHHLEVCLFSVVEVLVDQGQTGQNTMACERLDRVEQSGPGGRGRNLRVPTGLPPVRRAPRSHHRPQLPGGKLLVSGAEQLAFGSRARSGRDERIEDPLSHLLDADLTRGDSPAV